MAHQNQNQARFTVGMVLAMALTILAVMTWADRDLAAPSSSPIYQPQLLLLY
jgi:heme/copper-type cytochrome/quinol oxidase subunit 4